MQAIRERLAFALAVPGDEWNAVGVGAPYEARWRSRT
jgi:hypothetical protein